ETLGDIAQLPRAGRQDREDEIDAGDERDADRDPGRLGGERPKSAGIWCRSPGLGRWLHSQQFYAPRAGQVHVIVLPAANIDTLWQRWMAESVAICAVCRRVPRERDRRGR